MEHELGESLLQSYDCIIQTLHAPLLLSHLLYLSNSIQSHGGPEATTQIRGAPPPTPVQAQSYPQSSSAPKFSPCQSHLSFLPLPLHPLDIFNTCPTSLPTGKLHCILRILIYGIPRVFPSFSALKGSRLLRPSDLDSHLLQELEAMLRRPQTQAYRAILGISLPHPGLSFPRSVSPAAALQPHLKLFSRSSSSCLRVGLPSPPVLKDSHR